MKPVIVYLAQNSPKDAQYGRDSRTSLEKSLDLLYKNYNERLSMTSLFSMRETSNLRTKKKLPKEEKRFGFTRLILQFLTFYRKSRFPRFGMTEVAHVTAWDIGT